MLGGATCSQIELESNLVPGLTALRPGVGVVSCYISKLPPAVGAEMQRFTYTMAFNYGCWIHNGNLPISLGSRPGVAALLLVPKLHLGTN